ncbi:MAG: 3'-5' exonuclease [Chloroflexota bacterium]
MSLKSDYIIVIDMEATCWRSNRRPPDQVSEIIEIGVCVLDLDTLEPDRKMSILVKPTLSTVSEFCTRLTSLTQAQVDKGVTFEKAAEILQRHYDTHNHVWTSWGDYDRRMMQWESSEFKVAHPFGGDAHYFDLKQLYADVRNKGKRRGLVNALKDEKITLEGRHHRGDSDAWNTSRILAKMLHEDGMGILAPFMGEKEPENE